MSDQISTCMAPPSAKVAQTTVSSRSIGALDRVRENGSIRNAPYRPETERMTAMLPGLAHEVLG
jgi:hypothetical protein